MESRLSSKFMYGVGEIAQWLGVPALVPEDPGSIASTHIAAHICL